MRFNNAPVGIIHFDSNGNLTDCNDSFVKLAESSREALIGLNLLELPDKRIVTAAKKALKGQKGTFEGKYKFITSDKEAYLWIQFSPVQDDNPNAGFIGMVDDISERKLIEEKVRAKQFRDELTNLYNRSYFLEEMSRLDTPRQIPLTIILADLSGLNMVNNAFGNASGDKMLTIAAEILKNTFRAEDILARLESDKFAVLLPQTDADKAKLLADKITENTDSSSIESIPVSFTIGTSTKETPDHDIVTILNEAEADLYKNKLLSNNEGMNSTITKLRYQLSNKSLETNDHLEKMKYIARQIGEKLNLSDSELKNLDIAIDLHDIGKINIPEFLLKKKGALNKEEWDIIMSHPETGYRLIEVTEDLAHLAHEILAHHEHWNGKGYPQGLKEADIPLISRIIAVADAHEVMSSGRLYKKAMSSEEIIAEFKKCSGTQFDPELVEIICHLISSSNSEFPTSKITDNA